MEELKPKTSWLKVFTTIARLALWVFLLYNVYQETGIWTTISMFLLFIYIETQSIVSTTNTRTLSGFAKKVSEGFELRDKLMRPKSPEELVQDELKRRAREN